MKYLLAFSLIFFVGTSFAQDKKAKTETISFKVSVICGSCKDRIEKKLNYTKGVVFAEVDLDKKIVTVKYKTKNLNQDLIKGIVSKVGYDAGEVPRDPEAFEALPKCCKSEGHCR